MTFQVGDKVAYSVQFLKSTGMSHTDAAHARGIIQSLRPFGGKGQALATIAWDRDMPEKVLTANLAKVGPNSRFANVNPAKHVRRDRAALSELVLYIDNDSRLYHGQTVPIMKNLARKIRKGVYEYKKSVKLWQYLVDAGARKYVKEFGSPGARVDTMFNAATRRHAAKQYAAKFLRMWRNGELTNL